MNLQEAFAYYRVVWKQSDASRPTYERILEVLATSLSNEEAIARLEDTRDAFHGRFDIWSRASYNVAINHLRAQVSHETGGKMANNLEEEQ